MVETEENSDDFLAERDLIDYEGDWPVEGFNKTARSASKRTEPLERTSQDIASTLQDIATGRSNGEYPTVESIVKRQPAGRSWQPARPKQDQNAGTPDRRPGDIYITMPEQPGAVPLAVSLVALFFSVVTAMMTAYVYFIK